MIRIGSEALRCLLARRGVTFQRTNGIWYFHGCYSVGDDTLWGINPPQEGRREHPGRAEADPHPPGPTEHPST